MNLSRDTQKSLEMLLKSLKMNRRAVEKNQADDGTTDVEVQDMQDANSKMQDQIKVWLDSVIVPVAPVAPVATPSAPLIPTVDAGTNLTV